METNDNSMGQAPEKKKGKFLKTAVIGIAAIVIIIFVVTIGNYE